MGKSESTHLNRARSSSDSRIDVCGVVSFVCGDNSIHIHCKKKVNGTLSLKAKRFALLREALRKLKRVPYSWGITTACGSRQMVYPSPTVPVCTLGQSDIAPRSPVNNPRVRASVTITPDKQHDIAQHDGARRANHRPGIGGDAAEHFAGH